MRLLFGVVLMALSYMPFKGGVGLFWCLYGPATSDDQLMLCRDIGFEPGLLLIAIGSALAVGGFYLTVQGLKKREVARAKR